MQVSRRLLLQATEVEDLSGDELLQSPVLASWHLKAFDPAGFHFALTVAPVVIDMFADAEVSAHGGDSLAANKKPIGLPAYVEDLFRRMAVGPYLRVLLQRRRR